MNHLAHTAPLDCFFHRGAGLFLPRSRTRMALPPPLGRSRRSARSDGTMIGCGPRLGKESSGAHPSRIRDWDSNSDALGHAIISARGHQRRFGRVLVRPVYPLPKPAPEALLLPPRQSELVPLV